MYFFLFLSFFGRSHENSNPRSGLHAGLLRIFGGDWRCVQAFFVFARDASPRMRNGGSREIMREDIEIINYDDDDDDDDGGGGGDNHNNHNHNRHR